MKIRNGLVSNSSSSSFVLNKDLVNPLQLALLRNHLEIAKICSEDIQKEYGYHLDSDPPWVIEVDEETNVIIGHTDMDNFDMRWFMQSIGINPEDAKWKV